MFPSCTTFKLDTNKAQNLREHLRDDHIELRRCRYQGCGFIAVSVEDLISHSSKAPGFHYAFKCPVGNCGHSCRTFSILLGHWTKKHAAQNWSCYERGALINDRSSLQRHVLSTGHASFVCPIDGCQSTFSRVDVLEHHQFAHSATTTRYPCKYCKKYRGQDGFKRKDHLTQHVRNYHHIGEAKSKYGREESLMSCSHTACSMYKPEAFHDQSFPRGQRAFEKISDVTAHMKKAHNKSPFPYTEPGCPKIGGKGYFRQRDLFKHQKKEHAIADDME